MMSEIWEQFDRLIIFDTETTGIAFEKDRIIEIGAVAVEETGEADSLNCFIRLPEGKTLPPFITELTGITDEDLLHEGISDKEAAERFCHLLEG
ncbi:MAG: 3'-5' exonuclease, partial [Oscillibacter sp.]|nr:3'-5' exonuclease [Oscillibacter sp.]